MHPELTGEQSRQGGQPSRKTWRGNDSIVNRFDLLGVFAAALATASLIGLAQAPTGTYAITTLAIGAGVDGAVLSAATKEVLSSRGW